MTGIQQIRRASILSHLTFLGFKVEHKSQPELYRIIFASIWWAVIALTSVGYGDVYPVTVAGRMHTLAMVPTALLASALSRVTTDGKSDET